MLEWTQFKNPQDIERRGFLESGVWNDGIDLTCSIII
jgi:hypothetical protein